MIEPDVTGDAHFIVANSKENVAVVETSVFIQRVAVLEGQLCATVVFIELDVDNARNRIRSVGGRSAVFQNFDALNGRKRNGIQIDETGSGEPHDTAAIDQNEGGAHVEAAQRNRRRSCRTALARPVVLNRNAVRIRYRLILEQLFRVAFAGLVNQVAVEI